MAARLGPIRIGLLAAIVSLVLAGPASANFVVDDLDDAPDDDPTINTPCDAPGADTCTLRAALQQATVDGGTQAITFSLPGTITLENTLPALSVVGPDLKITGHAGGTIIDGDDDDRVMDVSGTSVTLEDLTIQDGSVQDENGGGIASNAATLKLDGVTVTSNTVNSTIGGIGGAGIHHNGTLELTDSTVSDNFVVGTNFGLGGGILSSGSLSLNRSTISGNRSRETANGRGGGLEIANILTNTITNSTISDNQAGSFGGGGISAQGGSATITILNSTIAGNSAAGVGADGGGISSFGTLHARNTIFAQNTATNTAANNCSALFNSAMNNIDGDTSCGFGTIFPGQGNLENVSVAQLNLGPLQNNGGPTATRALGAGSVAINTGDLPTCTAAPVNSSDQRLIGRPQGAGCDIGAYEFVFPLDLLAPNTVISKGPPKRTTKAKAKFTFSSTEAGSRFLCKLDKKSFTACISPKTYKVKRGKHTVQIQAIDAAGNADATPARFKWRRL